MESLKLYFKESYDELLNKVTWPTWSELLSHTRLVLISAAIFALVTFFMDAFSKYLFELIYSL